MKLFHEDNSRLRYLTREEYDRLIAAARSLSARTSVSTPSPYLEEKIVLAAHTGLRRGSLFNLRWDQIDFANAVMRIPRTKSGRPLSLPLNVTAKTTLQKLFEAREPEAQYVFPHKSGPNAGEPVQDIKNGFHAAREIAGIQNFTWHDLRQPKPPSATPEKGNKGKRTRKGQSDSNDSASRSEVPEFVKDFGSSGWIRTSNPPVNRRKTDDLPALAASCGDVPDRELDLVESSPIEDQSDAALCPSKPRLGVSRGQEKGKLRSG